MNGSARNPIFVTGATGKTGSLVVRELREAGWPVRAAVRRKDSRSEALSRLGAEVVMADLYDPKQLIAAMRGVSSAYICPPIQPYMIQSAVALAVAAREVGLRSAVLMSQWLSSPSHPSFMTRSVWLTDQLFSMTPDLQLTIVNPGWFADNYLRVLYFAVHLGIFPVFPASGRNAPPSNEDIARVVAAVLMNPDPHAGNTYRITGPKAMTIEEMVKVIQQVLGRKVRAVRMPAWMIYKAARLQGAPAFQVSSLRHYIQDHNQDAFGLSAPTDHVFRVTGKPAEEFSVTVQRYASLPINRRTFTNFLRVLGEFLFVPMAPGYDVKRYDREMEFPVSPDARYAMADPAWRESHTTGSKRNASADHLDFVRQEPARTIA